MNARLTPAVATHPELDAFWMPFTANRQFKANPRLLARAKGMYYTTSDGREVLDGVAGLWCVNAGHGRREITEAVTQQLETMEFAPTFQMGHPIAFELANIGTASVELRLVGGRLAQRSMSILHERYAANADTGEEMLTHAGEEGGVVVKGKIELTVGGESRVLGAGDAYYFKSSVPHRFRNIGREDCEIVSASSPPGF